VQDLQEARKFYVDVIGCTEGRADSNHLDFNMFGHHVVAHVGAESSGKETISKFDGRDVPIPHFGLNLEWNEWEELAERLRQSGARFRDLPHVRLQGRVGEHATLFVYDPSGNALEFKAFRDPSHVFALDLDPNDEDTAATAPIAAAVRGERH
jgi:extradiol dioxygenase family protein